MEPSSAVLSRAYEASRKAYIHSLTRPELPHWDHIILTASNELQAEGFRAQLARREEAGLLPAGTRFAVIPDPEGKRVGSGGATLGVIRYIAETIGSDDFSGLRILVIHSGGDSKRVPQYSALGKLFSPVPRELGSGHGSTLFDEFMITMSLVPSRFPEGMLLLSGDVLLLFDAAQIHCSGGPCVISFKESVHTGKNHGVFLRGEDGNVRKFLHKQSVESLTAQGAVDARGNVDIDTGAVLFSADMLRSLYGLISEEGTFSLQRFKSYVNETVRLSLYGDFLYPLATDATLEGYYLEKPEGSYSDALTAARRDVWAALRPYRVKLLQLTPAKFIHFGTTREIMALMSGGVERFAAFGWGRKTLSSIDGDAAAYKSILSPGATVGKDCYLEVSRVGGDVVLGDNVLLSHVEIQRGQIPSDVVLHGLKQRDGKYVVRIYGVGDDPKAVLEKGCSFLSADLRSFLERNGIGEEELWPSGEHSLWTAQLYPACDSLQEAVAAALQIYAMAHGHGAEVEAWRRAKRVSLCSGFNEADPEALICWEKEMTELIPMERLLGMIRGGTPVSQVRGSLSSGKLTPIQEQWLDRQLERSDLSLSMRLHYYIGAALGGSAGDAHKALCFETLRRTVLGNTIERLRYNEECRIAVQRHEVHLPLRVNWGGGWSDTPPYCNERGGTVLNAAITLDGQLPVEVILERTEAREIVFESLDMEVRGCFDTIAPLQRTGDPHDPFALQKACLLACGVICKEGGDLGEILDRLGGGFVMRTQVRGVPKGSGLGTSSVLSAACVKAMFGFLGIRYTEDALYEHVLCMEQIMSTGGGWQDQVGGVTNGLKYTTSEPGLTQKLRVKHLDISRETWQELNDRFVLIYTGQQRLAKDLLQDVVGRYLGNEPDSLFALNEIRTVAAQMRQALEAGDVDRFAQLLDYHWTLSLKIDSGSSNSRIDQIFSSIDDLIDGRLVCGAGGGGFLQVVMKKGVTREQLRQRLEARFPGDAVKVWDCALI